MIIRNLLDLDPPCLFECILINNMRYIPLFAKDAGLCDVRRVDVDAVRIDVTGMGGFSRHARVLRRDLRVDRYCGDRDDHCVRRL